MARFVRQFYVGRSLFNFSYQLVGPGRVRKVQINGRKHWALVAIVKFDAQRANQIGPGRRTNAHDKKVRVGNRGSLVTIVGNRHRDGKCFRVRSSGNVHTAFESCLERRGRIDAQKIRQFWGVTF